MFRWAPVALLTLLSAAAAQTSVNVDITITAASFFVSTSGSDTNAGTFAAPFATVNKCQTAMQGSVTKKTCYIRAGTYTGSGVGYTTVTTTNGYSVTEALYLTSSDNGETFSYYPPDGYNTAIFDGNAGTGGTNCPVNSVGTGVQRGIYGEGAQNLIINGLQFRFFCFSGISIHGGTAGTAGCMPNSPGAASGNLIENNIVHDIFSATSQCSGGFQGGTGGIEIEGNASSNTVTHNVVYNGTGMGIRAGVSSPPVANDNISSTTISNNYVYNTVTAFIDGGAIYLGQDSSATGIVVQYNYETTAGVVGCSPSPTAGQCSNQYYTDDSLNQITRKGNVATGGVGTCLFSNGGSHHTDTGNICDLINAGATTDYSVHAWYIQTNAVGNNAGPVTNQNNIVILNASSCAFGVDGSSQCAMQNNGYTGTTTIGPNDYWNYNAAGNSFINTDATNNGDTTPNNVDAFGNATTRCPSSNGFPSVNSWAYYIPAGNSVFGSPVNFPAQPAGWGTPGFWGPPGYVLPHNGNAPSYGPTC